MSIFEAVAKQKQKAYQAKARADSAAYDHQREQDRLDHLIRITKAESLNAEDVELLVQALTEQTQKADN